MWPFSPDNRRFERLASRALSQIATGPRVIVVGSQTFNSTESIDLCEATGRCLAGIPDLVLVTGGVSGVPESVGRSFVEERQRVKSPRNTYQLLPKGCGSWDFGETIIAGANMTERREILGRLGGLYIAIEGGPGTAHELSVAIANGSNVIPVGRCGGLASELWNTHTCPDWIDPQTWCSIGDESQPFQDAASSIGKTVVSYFRNQT